MDEGELVFFRDPLYNKQHILMSSMLLCLLAFSILLEKPTINWEISCLLYRALKPPCLIGRVLQVYFWQLSLETSFTQPKGQMPAGWIKTSLCKKWEMQMSVCLLHCYGHESRKNNSSSTRISRCHKINVWEQGQIEFKMTLYKEIIHIFTFNVFEPRRSGTDILRPFLP